MFKQVTCSEGNLRSPYIRYFSEPDRSIRNEAASDRSISALRYNHNRGIGAEYDIDKQCGGGQADQAVKST